MAKVRRFSKYRYKKLHGIAREGWVDGIREKQTASARRDSEFVSGRDFSSSPVKITLPSGKQA